MSIFRVFLMVFMGLFAVNPALASGAGPFGLEVGGSTRAEVERQFRGAESAGINRWSEGPMVSVPGSSLPLDGALSALFIFNPDDTLEAVIITLRKQRFEAIRGLLNELYRPVSARVPFVGDRLVTWEADGILIELDSPHLSFEMDLRYLAQGFLRRYREQHALEQQQQRQQQAGQL